MNSESPLRILIADDGALARQRIEDLLAELRDVRVVASVGTGEAAARAVRECAPDIAFLDVRMPGLSGMDVVREVGRDAMPVTVFVTAHDSHALDAFELAAVDYLLKPFSDERFAQALTRARRQHELRRLQAMTGYAERIAVESRGQVQLIPVAEIDHILASGHYAELHSGTRTWLMRERMDQLEQRLDPSRFFRVHRSAFVQLDRVTSLLKEGGGDYSVILRSGAQLSVSRSRVEALERRLGLAGTARRPE